MRPSSSVANNLPAATLRVCALFSLCCNCVLLQVVRAETGQDLLVQVGRGHTSK
jgi:hypothetical protein